MFETEAEMAFHDGELERFAEESLKSANVALRKSLSKFNVGEHLMVFPHDDYLVIGFTADGDYVLMDLWDDNTCSVISRPEVEDKFKLRKDYYG